MEYLIDYLKQNNVSACGEPLTSPEIVTTQKMLNQKGFACLPPAFLQFLEAYNGVKEGESAILGILGKNDNLDIVRFNESRNGRPETLILAYDDFTFLLYDAVQKKYFLIDSDAHDIIDEYSEDELELALNSIIHLDND